MYWQLTGYINELCANKELNPSQRGRFGSKQSNYLHCDISLLHTYIALSIMHTARGKKPPTTYLGNYNALRWLAAQPGEDNTVFTWLPVGVVTPRFVNKRAFMGHDHQTVNFTEKEDFGRSLLSMESFLMNCRNFEGTGCSGYT